MLRNQDMMKVRRARPSDARTLASVHARTWRLAYAGIIPAMALARLIEKRDETWWRRSAGPDGQLLVIEIQGSVAGYASCGAARGEQSRGEIFELYVAPEYQGMGAGSHLFEACRYHLDQRNLRGLIVWALTDNAIATAFYRRCGGAPVGKTVERFGETRISKTAFEFE